MSPGSLRQFGRPGAGGGTGLDRGTGLVQSDPAAEAVLKHLVLRGPFEAVREWVEIPSSRADWRRRLESAGWKTVPVETSAQPAASDLAVSAPSGTVTWRGGYDLAQLRQPAAVILDDLVITTVVSGRPYNAGRVPVGCDARSL